MDKIKELCSKCKELKVQMQLSITRYLITNSRADALTAKNLQLSRRRQEDVGHYNEASTY